MEGLGFRVQDEEFRVWVLGFEVRVSSSLNVHQRMPRPD